MIFTVKLPDIRILLNSTERLKIHFVTYADDKFKNSGIRIAKEAKDTGLFHGIHVFNSTDRERWFSGCLPETRKILDEQRGGGYWLWKPFCIYEALEMIKEGDVVVYADAGCTIYNSILTRFGLKQLINDTVKSESGVLRFENRLKERRWTKRDVFEKVYPGAFNDFKSKQLTTNRFIIAKRGSSVTQINEWIKIAKEQPALFSDIPSLLTNAPEFLENRHDQSVFSLISKRHGCLVRDISKINSIIGVTRIKG